MSKSSEAARQYQQEFARKCNDIGDDEKRQQWQAMNDFCLPDQETKPTEEDE